jgi:hypothetical protein
MKISLFKNYEILVGEKYYYPIYGNKFITEDFTLSENKYYYKSYDTLEEAINHINRYRDFKKTNNKKLKNYTFDNKKYYTDKDMWIKYDINNKVFIPMIQRYYVRKGIFTRKYQLTKIKLFSIKCLTKDKARNFCELFLLQSGIYLRNK